MVPNSSIEKKLRVHKAQSQNNNSIHHSRFTCAILEFTSRNLRTFAKTYYHGTKEHSVKLTFKTLNIKYTKVHLRKHLYLKIRISLCHKVKLCVNLILSLSLTLILIIPFILHCWAIRKVYQSEWGPILKTKLRIKSSQVITIIFFLTTLWSTYIMTM